MSVTVAEGAFSPNNDFGYVAGGLSGFAYVDANRNSAMDAGEAAIGGVVITGPSGTTTTAADGSYSFSNLDAATYAVSAPSTANGKALFTTSPLNVVVTAGETSPNNNFGYVTGGLSGFAYVDANRNSVKDAGEAGLGGVTITGPGGTTTTAADGSYAFSDLDAGAYSVSAPATASGKALFTGSPLSVTVTAGATSANNNFGYVTGGLSGFAYVDANRNSVKDAGEAGPRRRGDHRAGRHDDDRGRRQLQLQRSRRGHVLGECAGDGQREGALHGEPVERDGRGGRDLREQQLRLRDRRAEWLRVCGCEPQQRQGRE